MPSTRYLFLYDLPDISIHYKCAHVYCFYMFLFSYVQINYFISDDTYADSNSKIFNCKYTSAVYNMAVLPIILQFPVYILKSLDKVHYTLKLP